jgi:DNA repair exonuclease SbcCD ATPase subunit
MANLNIRGIAIRNWATITTAELEFPEYGLVLVLGNNVVSEGHLDSSGAGKTNFGAALSKAVMGLPEKPLVKFSRRPQRNDTYVRVVAELQGRPFDIEIGYRCKELSRTGEGIRFTRAGTAVSRPHISLTKEELAKVTGIASNLAQWTIWVDGDKIQFDELPQAKAVDLLMTTLHQPPWLAATKRSREVLDHFSGKHNILSSNADSTREKVSESAGEVEQAMATLTAATARYDTDVAEHQARVDAAESYIRLHRKRLEAIEAGQRNITKKLKQIEESKAERHKAIESSKVEIDGNLLKVQEEIQGLVKAHTTRQNARASEETLLNRPKVCPTCQRDWVMPTEQFESLQKKVGELRQAEDSAKAALDKARLREKALRGTQAGLNQQASELNADRPTRRLSKAHQKLGLIAGEIAADVRQLEQRLRGLAVPPDRSKVVEAETRLADKRAEQLRLQEGLSRMSGELSESEQMISVIKYWVGAFGAAGVSNMVLREAIGPLNEIARRVSHAMTCGMLEISFSTQRELATGEDKDELVVNIKNVFGSDDLDMSSKGERMLANLIIAETLSELSQASSLVNFSWYDEVARGLPPHVRAVLYQYLKEKAERGRQLIFVVDHNNESAAFANYVLMAEKTSAGTQLRWQ